MEKSNLYQHEKNYREEESISYMAIIIFPTEKNKFSVGKILSI